MFILVKNFDDNDKIELESMTIKDANIEALDVLGFTVLETEEQKNERDNNSDGE